LPGTITTDWFMLGAKGIMYDNQIGESEWSTAFPDFEYMTSTETA